MWTLAPKCQKQLRLLRYKFTNAEGVLWTFGRKHL